MDQSINIVGILRLIIRWKKPIIIVTSIALLASIIISDPHIIKPKYKSTASFFASSPNMTSSQTLYVENTADYFGTADDIDRLLSIANSAPLKSYIASKYKLFQHYDIDSANVSYPNYAVMKELEENVIALKNDKGAVEITVYDTDKKQAADMCNDIVQKVDDINNSIILENKSKVQKIYVNKIIAKEVELRALSDSIVTLKALSDQINSVKDLNRVSNMNDSLLRVMDLYEERLKIYEDRKKGGLKELNNTVALSEQYKSTLNKDVPTIFVLEKGVVAEKKSKPIRWLIVLGSTLGAFALSVLFLIFMERFKILQVQLRDGKKD